MPATTPKYAFPYPLGTDPVSDGDDAIKNLAQAVENTIAQARQWASLKNATGGAADQGWTPGSWAPVVTLTCTGAPIGAVLVAFGISEMTAGAAAVNTSARLTATGATSALNWGAAFPTLSVAATYYGRVVVENVFTTTAAAPTPTVSLEAIVSAAATCKAASSLVVIRVA